MKKICDHYYKHTLSKMYKEESKIQFNQIHNI